MTSVELKKVGTNLKIVTAKEKSNPLNLLRLFSWYTEAAYFGKFHHSNIIYQIPNQVIDYISYFAVNSNLIFTYNSLEYTLDNNLNLVLI